MSPYSEFSYMFEDAFGSAGAMEAMGAFLVVYLIIMAFASAYGILVYVLQSVGLYSIAKRRGIHHPWLAWIPYGNYWIIGSIADQYQYVAKGKIRNRRKVLLGLSIFYAVAAIVMVVGFVMIGVLAMESGMSDMYAGPEMIAPVLITIVGYFAFLILAVILSVFMYISYYNLFESCSPENAVLFLVLSIFLGFLVPYFVFACRKKDKGMPPRRPQIPIPTWQPAPPPPAPQWQQNQPVQQPWQPPVPPVPQPWQPPAPPAPQPWQPPEFVDSQPEEPEDFIPEENNEV